MGEVRQFLSQNAFVEELAGACNKAALDIFHGFRMMPSFTTSRDDVPIWTSMPAPVPKIAARLFEGWTWYNREAHRSERKERRCFGLCMLLW